ncbi:hypothetical protein os1_41290 [Comamonadaceae bacterium OS-1]|nr:hypothetical protein os1_41290 [Comamonadaceae bacterium OS-1]
MNTEIPKHLATALNWGVNPVCLEIALGTPPIACIRSSNSASLMTLEVEEVTAIIAWLRSSAVFPSDACTKPATLELAGEKYFANFCPQLDGVIVTVHRQWELAPLSHR